MKGVHDGRVLLLSMVTDTLPTSFETMINERIRTYKLNKFTKSREKKLKNLKNTRIKLKYNYDFDILYLYKIM